jgi:hypothetical protein
MLSLFEKYINGNCTEEECTKALQFIRNPDNDLFLDHWIQTNWNHALKTKTPIQPNLQLLDSIHSNSAWK